MKSMRITRSLATKLTKSFVAVSTLMAFSFIWLERYIYLPKPLTKENINALCRERTLAVIARQLPGFNPRLDALNWMWQPANLTVTWTKLPFGTAGLEERIAVWKNQKEKYMPEWYTEIGGGDLYAPPRASNSDSTSNEVNNQACAAAERTCVVVGNSGYLKNSSSGRVIDRHDVVIRLNDAPTEGYEADVGTKTHIRVFFPESASLVAKEAKKLLMDDKTTLGTPNACLYFCAVFKPADMEYLLLISPNTSSVMREAHFKKLKFWKKVPNPQELTGAWNKIHIFNPELMLEAKTVVGIKKKPSTGLNGVMLALHLCSLPITIVGFRYSTDPKEPSHYYDTWAKNRKAFLRHEVHQEREFLDKLIAMKFLQDLTSF